MNIDNIFYSVLKNEDATPYVGSNVLIVADGLGGSGSNVHKIQKKKGKSLRESIFEAAFNDFDEATYENTAFSEYLDHWVEPMADDESDTSAMWASRIAIARCAYALCYHQDFSQRDLDLSKDEERKELATFISKGLKDTQKYFDLQRGKYDDQKILPTTLAFMRYNTDENGNIIAEVVWAGDSRCYLLTREGLKQLSIDDEDQSGAITNLFYVGDKTTVLNYRKYAIEGPCVLIGASDGIFDPFEPHDNFGVEWILLKSISEASSYEDLMSKIEKFYDGVHSDDATMAFVPIGFEDFDDLKQSLSDRSQRIENMWKEYCETKSALEIVNSSEADVRGYVVSRTRDKLSSIMSVILQDYNNSDNSGNYIYTEELRKIIDNVKETAREERRQKSMSKLQSDIKDGKIQVDGIFNDNLKRVLPNDVIKLIDETKTCWDNLSDALKKQNQIKDISNKKAGHIAYIKERADAYLKEIYNWRGDDLNEHIDTLIRRAVCLVILNGLESGYIDWKKLPRKFTMAFSDNEENKRINDIIDFIIPKKEKKKKKGSKLSIVDLDKDIEAKQENFNTAIDKLFEVLKGNSSDYEKIFTREVVQEYQLATQDQNDTDDNIVGEVQTFVTKYKNDIVSAIVEALANNCDKESMIDGFYNATRLGSFRTYYTLKNNPNMSIEEFEAKLNELEDSYSQLLKDIV